MEVRDEKPGEEGREPRKSNNCHRGEGHEGFPLGEDSARKLGSWR
jgi:hypothetical protein